MGRHPSCNIVVPAAKVSKKHLQCVVENGVVTITDLGSSNGTLVNGSPVTSCVLKNGDAVSLGGYCMVLDTTPQPAPAGFDYEPAASTEPAPPAAGAAPSFENEPASDDTPADGTFVPQAYAPPQTLQPQVIARDGHMYLRDPRTNREIEIIARQPAGSTDLTGYYAEKKVADRKKNMYLIIGAVAVGILMILALVLYLRPPVIIPPPPKAFDITTYNEIVDKSIDQMNTGKFKEAIAELTRAHNEYKSYVVADTLREITKKWQASGKNRDEFNWLTVEPSLRELTQGRMASAKVRHFANDRIEWIYNVQHQEDIAAQAMALVAGGDPEKALAEFEKLPADSLVRKKHLKDIETAFIACYDKHLRDAKEAASRMNWPAAIQAYTAAIKYATPAQQADISQAVRTAQKRQNEERILNEANARLREDNPDSLKAALTLLDGIKDDSPLAAKAAELRRRINTTLAQISYQQKVSEATLCYKAGRGPDAIRIITENNLVELYPLRTKTERIIRMLAEAQTAYDAHDYDTAKARWAEVTRQAELDKDNAYHRTAAGKLADLDRPEKAREIALDYNRRADVALLTNGDPVSARKLYLTASRWSPDVGKDGLDNLHRIAEVTYNRGRDRLNERKIEEARLLFEKVLLYVDESDVYYQWSKRQLAGMEAP